MHSAFEDYDISRQPGGWGRADFIDCSAILTFRNEEMHDGVLTIERLTPTPTQKGTKKVSTLLLEQVYLQKNPLEIRLSTKG